MLTSKKTVWGVGGRDVDVYGDTAKAQILLDFAGVTVRLTREESLFLIRYVNETLNLTDPGKMGVQTELALDGCLCNYDGSGTLCPLHG